MPVKPTARQVGQLDLLTSQAQSIIRLNFIVVVALSPVDPLRQHPVTWKFIHFQVILTFYYQAVIDIFRYATQKDVS